MMRRNTRGIVGTLGRKRPAAARVTVVEQLERRACPAVVAVAGPVEVDETAGTADMVVSLSEPVNAPVTVGFSVRSTSNTAAFGRDYRLTLGRRQLPQNGLLTFSPGQTEQVITVRLLDDVTREGNESFTLALQRPRNATLSPTAGRLAVTILDDDAYTATLVGPATLAAGEAADYTLQLSSPATRRETFFISTRDGTARVTEDYRPLDRVPVTIQPGVAEARIRVVTVAKSTAGYDGSFFIDVEPATPGFPTPASFPINIPGPLGPRPPDISVADVQVSEGAAGAATTATFVVTLSRPWNQPVSVAYATTDGTATLADADYFQTSGIVRFQPGQTSQSVSVTVIGDGRSERNETFQLVLSNPANGIITRPAGVGTIVNDDGAPAPEFAIVVVFPDNSLSAAQQAFFVQAAARWSQLIVADLPDVNFQGRVIDDVEILATGENIDGSGGILGGAGPRASRPGGGLPYLGEMVFDLADIADLIAEGSFANVIIHEMGHVIGLGSLWEDLGLVQGLGTTNPVYTGPNAVRELGILSGTTVTSVPVENTGGQGTYGSHWRESVFRNELMTGYLNAGTNPISRLTVGALEDLGYEVDYAAADPYTLNVRQAALAFRRLRMSPNPALRRFMLVAPETLPASTAAAALFGTATDIEAGIATDAPLSARVFRSLGGHRG